MRRANVQVTGTTALKGPMPYSQKNFERPSTKAYLYPNRHRWFQPHERRNNLGTVSERGLEWLWAFLTQHRWRVNKASFRVGGRGRQAIVRYHSGSVRILTLC
ncbi:hypothetical protein AHAS_Ahas05G0277400 [Arachis hypogaea]